jgi:hypothetical protein
MSILTGEFPFAAVQGNQPAGPVAPVPLIPGFGSAQIQDPAPVFALFVDGLHASYRLQFVPPVQDDKIHDLTVSARQPAWAVHATLFHVPNGS